MTGLQADLVYNLDESSSQEWADRTDFKVVVPNSFEPDVVDVPYNRADEDKTLLVKFDLSTARRLREPRTEEDGTCHRRRLNIRI
jgi:hypothetical protein